MSIAFIAAMALEVAAAYGDTERGALSPALRAPWVEPEKNV